MMLSAKKRFRTPIDGLSGVDLPAAALEDRFHVQSTLMFLAAIGVHASLSYLLTRPMTWHNVPERKLVPLTVSMANAEAKKSQPARVPRPTAQRVQPPIAEQVTAAKQTEPFPAHATAVAISPAAPRARNVLAWTLPANPAALQTSDQDVGDDEDAGEGEGEGEGVEGFEAPRALHEVKPAYPAALRALGKEGDVALAVTITPEGKVGAIKITGPAAEDDFNTAARDAVQRATFTPPRIHGSPVATVIRLTVRFRLTDQ